MGKKAKSSVGDAAYDTVKGIDKYGLRHYNEVDECWEFTAYGKYIGVEEIFRDDNGNTLLKIGYLDLDGTEQSIIVDRSMLAEKKELHKKLLGKGADVHSDSIHVLLKCLAVTEANCPNISRCHTKTGWEKPPKTFQFKAGKLITTKATKSTYIGIYDLSKKGTFKDWKAMVTKNVIGWVPLEVVLLIGLSPLVSGLLDDCRLIFHLMGDSSRGKTTAGILAVSVAGCPIATESAKRKNLKGESLHSLLTSWNGTDNAITGMLTGLDGTIIVLDELSKLSSASELSKILYTMSDGIDKNRMKGSKEVDDTGTFNTNILSIGEESLIAKAKNANTGIRMRTCELRADFTKDAAQSVAIKIGCYENYGFAAPKMARYMVDLGYEKVRAIYQKWFNSYHASLIAAGDTSNSSDRLATFGSVLLATAEIATDALGISFSIDEIKAFMLNQMMAADATRTVGKRAHEALWSYIIQHYAHFTVGNDIEWKKSIDCYGRIEPCKIRAGKEVSFHRETLTHILTVDLGFSNAEVIVDYFKENGLLNYEGAKNYRKRKIISTDRPSPVFAVIFPDAT